MKVVKKIIRLKTKSFLQFIDLTDKISFFLKRSSIKNGFITVFTKHTTTAIRINEKEKGIVNDFKKIARKIAHEEEYWEHNDLTLRTENLVCEPGASDCLNGHSHILQLFLGTSETIPIIDGKMILGIYQRIFLIELDCSKKREVIVQIIGH